MFGHQIVFTKPNAIEVLPLEKRDLGEDDILIRTEVTLISIGTELTVLSGDFPRDSSWGEYAHYPFVAGYSNVGVVEFCGPKATVAFKPGDRVVSSGPHATYVIQPTYEVMKVPEGVKSEDATFWNLGRTVMNGVRLAEIALGEPVVVVGAGILGNLASQYARLNGARPVILTDVSQDRLDKVPVLQGIHKVLASPELLSTVEDLTHGRKASVVFEATGNPQALSRSLELACRRGRVIVLGSPRGPVSVDFYDRVHLLGLHIIGAHVSTHPEVETPYNEWTRNRNGELFLNLLSSGELQLSSLVTHRFDWSDAVEVYGMLLNDRTKALGVVLNWR